MKSWLIDAAIGAGLALAIVILLLFTSFNSTFVYRGF
jgi:hypothetical protein